MTKEALELQGEMPTLGPEGLVVESQRTLVVPGATTAMVLGEVKALRSEVADVHILLHKIIKWALVALVLSLAFTALMAQNTLSNWQGDFYWDAPTGPAPTCYNFYKSLVSGGPYTKVNTDCITLLTFNDPAAVEGQFFAVASVNSTGLEGLSNEITLTDPAPPKQFRFILEGTLTVIP